MKKLFALLLVLVMSFSLAACGGGDDTPPSSVEDNPPASSQQQETPSPDVSQPDNQDNDTPAPDTQQGSESEQADVPVPTTGLTIPSWCLLPTVAARCSPAARSARCLPSN